MKYRLSALQYLKEREQAKEYWKMRLLYEVSIDERQRRADLENACTRCYMIRSKLEIKNNTCDNCN